MIDLILFIFIIFIQTHIHTVYSVSNIKQISIESSIYRGSSVSLQGLSKSPDLSFNHASSDL